jgi:hypothetical protein
MPATLVLTEPVGHVACARRVGELQPGLLAVGAGQPAEKVVERPVLHHQDDDVVDARRGRRREPTGGGRCRDTSPPRGTE